MKRYRARVGAVRRVFAEQLGPTAPGSFDIWPVPVSLSLISRRNMSRSNGLPVTASLQLAQLRGR